MKSKPKTIAFYGLFGQQNWGNEWTLEAMISNVRRYFPDARLRCFCTGPDDVAARHRIAAFPISNRYTHGYPPPKRRPRSALGGLLHTAMRIPNEILHWIRVFRSLKGVDMLVVPGTGLLTDFATNPLGGPYILFKWSVVAKLRRCKLLFVSVGAGPMSHPMTKWFIKRALSLADYRSYRDGYSRDFLKAIGFAAHNDPLYPDLVFSLPLEVVPEREHRNGSKPIIGVGVKDYVGKLGLPECGEGKYRDFIAELGAFVSWLIDNRYPVRLLIGDTLYDNTVKEDVLEWLRQRGQALDSASITNANVSSGAELLLELAATDIVVSARFHNVLVGLMLRKPAISLSYHEKFRALVAGVGLPQYCHDIDELDAGKLAAQVEELDKRAADLRPQIKRKVDEYREALEEQYARMFQTA